MVLKFRLHYHLHRYVNDRANRDVPLGKVNVMIEEIEEKIDLNDCNGGKRVKTGKKSRKSRMLGVMRRCSKFSTGAKVHPLRSMTAEAEEQTFRPVGSEAEIRALGKECEGSDERDERTVAAEEVAECTVAGSTVHSPETGKVVSAQVEEIRSMLRKLRLSPYSPVSTTQSTDSEAGTKVGVVAEGHEGEERPASPAGHVHEKGGERGAETEESTLYVATDEVEERTVSVSVGRGEEQEAESEECKGHIATDEAGKEKGEEPVEQAGESELSTMSVEGTEEQGSVPAELSEVEECQSTVSAEAGDGESAAKNCITVYIAEGRESDEGDHEHVASVEGGKSDTNTNTVPEVLVSTLSVTTANSASIRRSVMVVIKKLSTFHKLCIFFKFGSIFLYLLNARFPLRASLQQLLNFRNMPKGVLPFLTSLLNR